MSDPEELQHSGRSSRRGCLNVGAVLLLLLYGLSPPFVSIALEFLPPAERLAVLEVVLVIYAPINWLYDRVELVKDFYDWYQGLFD